MNRSLSNSAGTVFVAYANVIAEHYPDGATKVEGSLEVRDVPETDAELEASSTSSFQRPSAVCCCLGARWVCEDHRDKPWEHDGCGGAGAPCVCNPKGAVEFVEVFAEVEPRPSDGPLQ